MRTLDIDLPGRDQIQIRKGLSATMPASLFAFLALTHPPIRGRPVSIFVLLDTATLAADLSGSISAAVLQLRDSAARSVMLRTFQEAGHLMRLSEKITAAFSRNPTAWILLALFLVAEYWNYQHAKQLDAVCEAIKWPDVLPDRPKTDYEKAQLICVDRLSDDLPTE